MIKGERERPRVRKILNAVGHVRLICTAVVEDLKRRGRVVVEDLECLVGGVIEGFTRRRTSFSSVARFIHGLLFVVEDVSDLDGEVRI